MQHHKPQYVIPQAQGARTDSYGRIRYHKPSYTVGKDGRIAQTNAYGKKLYDKPQYQIKDGKSYETNAYGRYDPELVRVANLGGVFRRVRRPQLKRCPLW